MHDNKKRFCFFDYANEIFASYNKNAGSNGDYPATVLVRLFFIQLKLLQKKPQRIAVFLNHFKRKIIFF